jgi:hypothetical protein
MQALSSDATAILEVMEPNRLYKASELCARFSELSMDALRDIMHELWVKRHVERHGHLGWLRQQTTCASEYAQDPRSCVHCRIARSCSHYVPPAESQAVRPEQLFDHESFPGLFT